MWFDANAAVRKDRISRDHLIERHLSSAERGWQIRRHRHFDSKAPHHLRAGLNADRLQHVYRRNVHRLRQRRLHRHVAVAGRAVIVVGLPVTDFDRRAADGRLRRHAPLDRGGVNERFECRTGLTISLHAVVEFVRKEIVATLHRYDLAGLRIERHQRAFNSGNLIKLNFQPARFLIDTFDYELGKIARLEFAARRAAAPAHVGARYRRRVIAKANRGIRGDLHHQAFDVTAFDVFVAIPVGILVAVQFLLRWNSILRRGGNRFVRRSPPAALVIAPQTRAHNFVCLLLSGDIDRRIHE